MMEQITLYDFLSITGLSERVVLQMLASGELPSAHGPSGEVLIDINRVSPELLANRSSGALTSEDDVHPLIGEIVASEVLASLDEIVDEALAMATSWLSQKDSS